jgi:uncharacterized protein with von Willebrand factor type A (vWA) domain
MEIKATDLSARLLATENLSVVRARARTASFDIKSRVLTLPLWKDMTPEIEDMLVGHEVGHALFTDGESYFEPIRKNPKLMGYFNIIEDVRIEKLIKRKYPGLRKRMNEGYKQLNDRDFFGVKQVQDLNSMILIDKINLYFKAGFQCGVTFTPEEKNFVNRAERIETIDEVITLANEIFAYTKEKIESEKKEQKNSLTQEELEDLDEENQEFDDIDYDDFEEDENDVPKTNPVDSKKSSSNEATDAEMESKTERSFAKQLEDLADDTTEYVYHELDTEYYKSPIIPYHQILSETNAIAVSDDMIGDVVEYKNKQIQEYEKFKTETTRAVNYLVKEFEMRKSAQLYKRAQTSKSGSLDMKRVWSYKIQDDLFKRVTVLPEGKNHGMMFLLDWSGSMDNVIHDTLKQVINLAMFCTRINIPYRVFAFTTQYDGHNRNFDPQKYDKFLKRKEALQQGKNILGNATTSFNLLELFSNKMSTSEFHSMAKRVIQRDFQWNPGYSMGGTPLNEALAWVYLNIGEYIKSNSIEKMTFITLTDGEGSSLYSTGSLEEHSYAYDEYRRYKTVKRKHFIRDAVTQKTYGFSRYNSAQTETLLRMIKDRHNINVLGFYICRNTRNELISAIRSNLANFSGNENTQVDLWRKDFKQQGFASIKNTGRDELFLIPKESTKIEEGDLNVSSDTSAKSIASKFGKFLNTKKTSRVLLNRFIGYVA